MVTYVKGGLIRLGKKVQLNEKEINDDLNLFKDLSASKGYNYDRGYNLDIYGLDIEGKGRGKNQRNSTKGNRKYLDVENGKIRDAD